MPATPEDIVRREVNPAAVLMAPAKDVFVMASWPCTALNVAILLKQWPSVMNVL